MSDSESEHMRSDESGFKALVVALTSIFSLVLGFSIYAQLPATVVTVGASSEAREFWGRAYPQGWQFFTKDPDDPEITVFAIGNDGVVRSLSVFPNSRVDNLIGFSRAQRSQGPELSAIVQQVPEWTECGEFPDDDCLALVAITGTPNVVMNNSPVPTVCGEALLAVTIPVPWEYRDLYEGWRIEDAVARVTVQC